MPYIRIYYFAIQHSLSKLSVQIKLWHTGWTWRNSLAARLRKIKSITLRRIDLNVSFSCECINSTYISPWVQSSWDCLYSHVCNKTYRHKQSWPSQVPPSTPWLVSHILSKCTLLSTMVLAHWHIKANVGWHCAQNNLGACVAALHNWSSFATVKYQSLLSGHQSRHCYTSYKTIQDGTFKSQEFQGVNVSERLDDKLG